MPQATSQAQVPDRSPGRPPHCRARRPRVHAAFRPRSPRCAGQRGRGRGGAAGGGAHGAPSQSPYFSVPGEQPQATGPAAHMPLFQGRPTHACPSTSSSEAPRGPDVSQDVLRRTPREEPDLGLPSDTSRCPVACPGLARPFPPQCGRPGHVGPPRPSASQPSTATPPPRETREAWTLRTRGGDRRQDQSWAGWAPAPRTPLSTSGAEVKGGHRDQALSPVLDPRPGDLPPGGHTEGALRSSRAQEGRESALGRAGGPDVGRRPPPQ